MQTLTQDGIQGQGALPQHLLVARHRGALLACFLVEVCQHHIDLQTTEMWGQSRGRKEKESLRKVTTLSSSLRYNTEQNENCGFFLSTEIQFFYPFVRAQCALKSALHQRNQKMSKCSYTMPKGSVYPLISLFQESLCIQGSA